MVRDYIIRGEKVPEELSFQGYSAIPLLVMY